MITSSHEYMQRLQDIQNQDNLKELVMLPSDEPRFIIDANERTISIPDGFTFLGVLNDHNAETVYFEIDRYYDQTDLSQKPVSFNTNPRQTSTVDFILSQNWISQPCLARSFLDGKFRTMQHLVPEILNFR